MIKVALIGNPNVGKSTLFNELTGLRQHTGNWTGKTVGVTFGYHDNLKIYDLPGTYSLIPHSKEEEITSEFILNKQYDIALVVCDALALERNLTLVMQTMEVTSNVILCINLIDEAKKKKIFIDADKLSEILNIPVVCISARKKIGINTLLDTLNNFDNSNNIFQIKYDDKIEECISIIEPVNCRLDSIIHLIKGKSNNKLLNEKIKQARLYLYEENVDILSSIKNSVIKTCEEISNKVVIYNDDNYLKRDYSIDKILTNKFIGIPLMVIMLVLIFYISIKGANYPSNLLFSFFNWFGNVLKKFLINIKIPSIIYNPFMDGMYKVSTWVIAVMLPPMAIFFPLFTILEDLGILPRIAFNLDGYFQNSKACGKQALTMTMGFGCNAVGVTGSRIIDSKRERIIAILTNSFVPCNGRFPLIITILTLFFIGTTSNLFNSILSIILLILVVLLGIFMTFVISKVLSKTILKGLPSFFVLELPPYRKPQIGKIIVRSIFDRTLFVLGRAILVALPAGLIIWIVSNININDISILTHLSNLFNNFGLIIGMDGAIILAFLLGFPANEIVMPIILMIYMSSNNLVDINDLNSMKNILISNGWNYITAISVLIFTLFHFPCSTTLLTIKKETNSIKWTLLSFVLPLTIGIILCFIVSNILKIML